MGKAKRDLIQEEVEEMFADLQEAHEHDIRLDYVLDGMASIVTNKRHPFYKLKQHFEPWEIAVRALAISGFLETANKFIMIPSRGENRLVSRPLMFKKAKEISRKFDEIFGKEGI